MEGPYATTYHRDGSVTVWDVYAQQWLRTDNPSARVLASMSRKERERVILHCSGVPVLTGKFTTIATVGFAGCVSSNQNRAAHGSVCHLQARRTTTGFVGRRVNSNGRHSEIGEAFPLTADTLVQWSRIHQDRCRVLGASVD